MPEEIRVILGREHAGDHDQRARHPLLKVGQGRGDRAATVGIMAAIEPEFAVGWRKRREPALTQALHARGPFGLDQPGFISDGGNLQPAIRSAAIATPALTD